jgi:hypothetical protein
MTRVPTPVKVPPSISSNLKEDAFVKDKISAILKLAVALFVETFVPINISFVVGASTE